MPRKSSIILAAAVAACQLKIAKLSMSFARRRRRRKKGSQNGQWRRSRTSATARIAIAHLTPIRHPHRTIHLTAHPILLPEGSGRNVQHNGKRRPKGSRPRWTKASAPKCKHLLLPMGRHCFPRAGATTRGPAHGSTSTRNPYAVRTALRESQETRIGKNCTLK